MTDPDIKAIGEMIDAAAERVRLEHLADQADRGKTVNVTNLTSDEYLAKLTPYMFDEQYEHGEIEAMRASIRATIAKLKK